ncbi:acyltransferase family protein [Neisseria sp. CCUG12390]|uniref:acyltransferase family protein n=1 Tax=Neisseria sp. CCUG12390 TaxID=3392035 RepID=UPI003A0FDDD1
MNILNYRADIDGLRAIAVLAVIIFHLNPNWLPGGFLGVDIFFVLSGYLITSIIYQQMKKGSFSFYDFYKRRIKRILPAFIFVLAVATPVAVYLFLPNDTLQYLKSAIASLFSAANLFFARKGGYFDSASTEKPLLHMWSLSVEEQFYFVFPVILLFFFKFYHSKIKLLLSGLILISLATYFLPSFGLDRYFLPYVRAYELLIGALFAFITPKESNKWVSWLLLATIIGLMFIPHDTLWGNGYIEKLIACTCVGLMILFGHYRTLDKSDWVFRFLSAKPMVMIGLISYSLYLWHWVILALIRYVYMDNELPYTVYLAATLAMFVLAWISYVWIETPCRKIKHFSNKQMWATLAVYFGLALPLYAAIIYVNKAPSQEMRLLTGSGVVCQDTVKNGECSVGEKSKPVNILFAGDSHAGQYYKFLDIVGKKEGWAADVISGNSCAVAFGFTLSETERSSAWCNPINRHIEENYRHYDTVIFAQRWSLQIPKADFLPKFEKTIQTLLAEGKKVYVFRDNPLAPYNILRKYHLAQKGIDIDYVHPKRYEAAEQSEQANIQIQKLLQNYPEATWVDTTPYLPKDFKHNGLPVYSDYDHLNAYGSQLLGERFSSQETLLQPRPL